MKNKINVAELLRDCPKGMELYSPIFGEVYLDKVRPHLAIVVTTDKEQGDFKEEFLYDGRYGMNGECMLFPSKGKTTWDGFHRPFKDGEVVAFDNPHIESLQLFIFKNKKENTLSSCYLMLDDDELDLEEGTYHVTRLATEEEKQKLFQAIKDNGYKWNAETKTLEKLIEPKFRVGDKIKYKNGKNEDGVEQGRILSITDDTYDVAVTKDMGIFVPIADQDEWELVPDKFDINTLKPFDKVLVRGNVGQKWTLDFFGFMDKDKTYPFVCVGHYVPQCIPYEGNEHLLGKTDECDKHYKIWRE